MMMKDFLAWQFPDLSPDKLDRLVELAAEVNSIGSASPMNRSRLAEIAHQLESILGKNRAINFASTMHQLSEERQ